MSEKITLDEEQKGLWEKTRNEALNQLISEALAVNSIDTIRYFVEVGVSRAFDQRFSTAEKKLTLIESDKMPCLTDLVPRGTEKSQLVRELASKQDFLTKEMLQKLSVEQLRRLAEKI